MNPQEEARIIGDVQSGQSEPFAHLVRHYQGALFRIVANLVGPQKAEDMVQETFLAAFRNIHSFDPAKGLFRSWLFRIARNLAFNELKKKRPEALPEALAPVDHQTPATQMLRREIFRQLDRALEALPFRDRVIFTLAEIEELPYAEIARIEDIRLGTVKSRLARTRAKLRTLIGPYVKDNE